RRQRQGWGERSRRTRTAGIEGQGSHPQDAGRDQVAMRGAVAGVVIVASGPSLKIDDCDLVRQWPEAVGGRCIVINPSYQRAPWADVLYACDGHWWAGHVTQVRQTFHGEQWTQDEAAAKSYGLNFVKSERKEGLGRKPGVIHQ